MNSGHFYYITDQYFIDFPDSYLMKNKEAIDGTMHDRPCFYAYKDNNTGLFWMIPFSPQVHKYKKYYADYSIVEPNDYCSQGDLKEREGK